jgi:molybdate transport system regulatory protein
MMLVGSALALQCQSHVTNVTSDQPRIISMAIRKKKAPRLYGKLELDTDVGIFLGDTRVRLLEAIDQTGSILQAAKLIPLSYKAAWEAVDAMNNLAEYPLVERTTGGKRGGGTLLTDYGHKVIAMYRAIEGEYQEALDRLATRFGEVDANGVRSFQRMLRRMSLRTSARNQFPCTISGLREGDVEYEVFLRLDAKHELVAVVTRESAENLGLAIGQEVVALVKASAVMLVTERGAKTSARNHLWGTVARVIDGPVNAEVTIDLGGGKSVTSTVTHASVGNLGLAEGVEACAIFMASSVILSQIA